VGGIFRANTYKSAVNEKLAVHSYGPNVAVVIGTTHEKGQAKTAKHLIAPFGSPTHGCRVRRSMAMRCQPR